MRKQTKLVAVLSAAALLAIGASMTSFAAAGWQEENGTWVYYDKDGYQVSDQWQKSGNTWFYLNSDGEMATDTIIEDDDNTYYVDANGAMVTNQWIQVENSDSYGDDDPDYFWYYFQANGKAYKAPTSGKTSFKNINGKKYTFDSEGKMLYGWINTESERQTGDDAWTNGTYFCGDENDGAQANGWAQISVVDDSQDDPDQDYYFYFDTNGKKVVGKEDGSELKSKTINGLKYSFDKNGKMVSEWAMPKASKTEASISSYNYFNLPEQGWRAKGWFNVVPQEDVNPDDNADDASKWFYAENDGDLVKSEIKTINSKKYAFNAKGEMLSGVQALAMTSNTKIVGSNGIGDAEKVDLLKNGKLEVENYENKEVKYVIGDNSDSVNVYVYYFGAGSDGSMKTGNQNIDIDGDVYAFSFGKSGSNKGRGLNETKDTLYVNGLRIKADSDMRYQVYSMSKGALVEDPADFIGETDTYVVNTSGSIMKNKKNLKDTDDMYICTDKDGHIRGYSDIKCGTKADKDGKGAYTCKYHE